MNNEIVNKPRGDLRYWWGKFRYWFILGQVDMVLVFIPPRNFFSYVLGVLSILSFLAALFCLYMISQHEDSEERAS